MKNFCRSLKKIIKHLKKGKNKNIFDKKEELPLLEETIIFLDNILKKYYCLCIVPQAFQIGKENKLYNNKELKEIEYILSNIKIFDNQFTNKLIYKKKKLKIIERSTSFP